MQQHVSLEIEWITPEKDCYCHKNFDLPDCTQIANRPSYHAECGIGTESFDGDFGNKYALDTAKLLMETDEVLSIELECDSKSKMWNLRFKTFSTCASKLAHYFLFVES